MKTLRNTDVRGRGSHKEESRQKQNLGKCSLTTNGEKYAVQGAVDVV